MTDKHQAQIEKLKLYARIKWGTIAVISCLIAGYALLGVISAATAALVAVPLLIAVLANLWLILEIRGRKRLRPATHGSLTLDILVIISALYLGGGMENTWLFAPVIIIYAAGYLAPLRASLVYAALSFSLVLAMFLLEYYRFIPHFSAYGLPEFYWRYPQYAIDYLGGMFVLYFVAAFAGGYFNQLAGRRTTMILEYSRQLEKSQIAALAAEQRARRAKDELANKVAELEKFQKVAVDRELKMIELKKEIERLKHA